MLGASKNIGDLSNCKRYIFIFNNESANYLSCYFGYLKCPIDETTFEFYNYAMLNVHPLGETEFLDTCRRIAAKWRIDKHDQKRRPLLERRVYELGEHLIAHGLIDEFLEGRLKLMSNRGRSKRPNPFSQLLRVIFYKEANSPDRRLISSSGRRLYHAYWHFVPPEFLSGFLDSAGANPKLGTIQAGYERWVMLQLQEERNTEIAFGYPKKLKPKRRLRYWREPSD